MIARSSGTRVEAALSSVQRDAVDALHPAVRRLHLDGESIRVHGRFAVRRGNGILARLAASVLRFPHPGRNVPMTLEVDRSGRHDTWLRSFDGRALNAEFRVDGTHAVERVGLLELRYDAAVERGALRLRSRGARLRVGPLSIAIPWRLAPRVRTRTWARDGRSRIHACIVIFLPVGGLLLVYRGWVEETAS